MGENEICHGSVGDDRPILLLCNSESKIASGRDLFEKVFGWRLDFRGQRGAEERERLLYIRLHVELRLRRLCQAAGVLGAKG